jgi:hypothetical protein
MNIFHEVVCSGALVSGLLILGCQGSPQQAKSPGDQAAEMARTRCGPDLDENALTPVLDGRALRGVQPLYNNVEEAKGGNQSELRGAIVDVQPIQGVTAEWLDRALECHSAKRVLGQTKDAAGSNDPFWLPGSIVDIDVRSAKDGFRIAVAGSTPADAQQILSRAKAFAGAKAGVSDK